MPGYQPTMSKLDQELFNAAFRLDIETAKSCLEQGACAQRLDAEGCNSLHVIALASSKESTYENRLEMVRFLIAAGMDLNARNHSGYSPLMIAAINRQPLTLKAFLTFNPSLDGALHKACEVSENIQVVQLLVEKGANPLELDADNMTVLQRIKSAWGGPDYKVLAFIEAAKLQAQTKPLSSSTDQKSGIRL